ncbi:histamine N-methyltransferase-like isoform X2 [Brachyhypopomus gauderio]|uniref:histamine N-methyltransferase-like isoform X2 n=1 Tax=Brachyhypopomus gauderio TaxID=698409 RepID=UPI004041F731
MKRRHSVNISAAATPSHGLIHLLTWTIGNMAATLNSLMDSNPRYLEAFDECLKNSTEHQCMITFIQGPLQDALTSIGEGKTSLNVMGVGSGLGQIDLEIIRQLRLLHPKAKVDNEVVEPSSDMLDKYKDLVSKTSDLDHVTFTWNNMKTSEFEKAWKERNPDKKMDFIHMIQMLYYVEDSDATLLFFRSLLRKNGKLLIILLPGDTFDTMLWETYGAHFCKSGMNQFLTAKDVKNFMDTKGISYQSYSLPSYMDVTSCFIPGDVKGELLLDSMTEVQNFSKNASPELMEGVLKLLRDYIKQEDGKSMLDTSIEALLIDP